MRLCNEKNEKKPINVLAKHGITHDMRIQTKVVYGMPIWAFTFLRGTRGEGARAWKKKVFVTPQKYPRIFIIILLYILSMNLAKLGFFPKN